MAENKSTILLEAGNNQLELLTFKVNKLTFGINVAKVAEIIGAQEVTPVPEAAEGIRGIFSLRDKVVSVIDLNRVLFHKDSVYDEKTIFVCTNFNGDDMAFIADEISMIRRYRWSDICKPDSMISNAQNGMVTGIVREGTTLVCILDFEKIVRDISPTFEEENTNLDVPAVQKGIEDKRKELNLLLAEDSKMLNRMLMETLTKAGYRVESTENGNEAWDLIQSCRTREGLLSRFDCLVTDIEMPAMDGLTLSKNIKTNEQFKDLPIIVFSSLVNEALIRKVQDLHIDELVTKPNMAFLVEVIDRVMKLTD